jgi:hypothetical protein
MFSIHSRRLAIAPGVLAACAGLFGCSGESDEVLSAAQRLTTTSFRDGESGYFGTSDTYLRERSATTNYGSSIACHADGDDGSGTDKSCLLRWDVSAIPAGATVTSASITLRIVDASSQTYQLYGLKRSWSEAQATWNQAASSSPWGTAGAKASTDRGELIGSVSGSTGSVTVALNAAGVALVQGWVSGGTNAGIIIANPTNSNGIDFASSEHGTVSYRPRLSVTYETGTGGTGGTSGTGGAGGTGGSGGSTGGSGGSTGGSGGSTGGSGGAAGSGGSAGGTSTVPNLLVAFIGDQGANGNSDAVLNLIKAEGAAATVHNGDFDYADNPSAWNSRIDRVLGANYPYFAVVGNHDGAAWNGSSGYQAYINARVARVPEMNCTGDLGVKATCKFRGLQLIQSCVGTTEVSGHGNCGKDSSEQVSFIQNALATDDAIWAICSWHKNQNDMQTGSKSDEVGWNAYKACMNGGGIVSTGHEHAYSRTLTLMDLGNRAAGHGAIGAFDQMEVTAGKTFVFVSGLAGVGVRSFISTQHDDDTWWASYYTSNRWLRNGVRQSGTGTYGALFIRFHVNGDPRRAEGYFKDVNGRIADSFTIFAR